MKKFLKLCLAVAALATMFGFASCSNGSSDDSTATTPAATKTVKYSVTINSITFSYTEENDKPVASDTVKIADDGTITITGSDGTSTIKVSKDGKTITYVLDGTTYTADMSNAGKDGSVTLTSEDGKTISATAKRETVATPSTTPAATTNSIVGSKYYNYGIDNKNGKIKIKVSTFTIDSTSAGTHKTLSTTIKNGAVTETNDLGSTTFTYSVSGSTINITEDGKTMALAVGADNSLTDEMNHKFTKFDGEIYGSTTATDANNYSYTVLLLGKDGTGKIIIKRIKDGSEKGTEDNLTNLTTSGSTISFSAGDKSMTATYSDDKSTVTVNDGKNNPVLTKL